MYLFYVFIQLYCTNNCHTIMANLRSYSHDAVLQEMVNILKKLYVNKLQRYIVARLIIFVRTPTHLIQLGALYYIRCNFVHVIITVYICLYTPRNATYLQQIVNLPPSCKFVIWLAVAWSKSVALSSCSKSMKIRLVAT